MRDATAIAGLGATPYYRRGGSAPQTRYELVGKAVLAAVADAGLAIEDVDGFTFYAGGLIDPAFLVEMLGVPELNFAAVVSGGGGGSAGAVGLASMAVATGQARAVVAVGMCQQAADHRYGSVFTHFTPSSEVPFFSAAGLVGPGQAMAMMARRRMHRFGERREHYAEVAISTRLYASTRETALKREPLTLDDYFAAPMVAEPLCLFDYCLETDGAVAVVVTSTERARDLRQPPVRIAGAVQGGSGDWGRGFFWQNMPEETYLSAGEHPVARRLYEMAGVTAADIDVALLYDHFAPLVLSQLEDYGFCPRGEAGPFVAGGAIREGGTIPVNTHGGHLSEAYVSGGPAPIPLSGLILRR